MSKKYTLALMVLGLGVVMVAGLHAQQPKPPHAFTCEIVTPEADNVTTLKCVGVEGIKADYPFINLPGREYRFEGCKVVSFGIDKDGVLQVADHQTKGCRAQRAKTCSGVELSDNYSRQPIIPGGVPWVMPCVVRP